MSLRDYLPLLKGFGVTVETPSYMVQQTEPGPSPSTTGPAGPAIYAPALRRAEVVEITPEMQRAYRASMAPNIVIRNQQPQPQPLTESQLLRIQQDMKARQEFQQRVAEAAKSEEERYWDRVRKEKQEFQRQADRLEVFRRADAAEGRRQAALIEQWRGQRSVPGTSTPRQAVEGPETYEHPRAAKYKPPDEALRLPHVATPRPSSWPPDHRPPQRPRQALTREDNQRLDSLIKNPETRDKILKYLGADKSDWGKVAVVTGYGLVIKDVLNYIQDNTGLDKRSDQIDVLESGVRGGIGASAKTFARKEWNELKSAFAWDTPADLPSESKGILNTVWSHVKGLDSAIETAASNIEANVSYVAGAPSRGIRKWADASADQVVSALATDDDIEASLRKNTVTTDSFGRILGYMQSRAPSAGKGSVGAFFEMMSKPAQRKAIMQEFPDLARAYGMGTDSVVMSADNPDEPRKKRQLREAARLLNRSVLRIVQKTVEGLGGEGASEYARERLREAQARTEAVVPPAAEPEQRLPAPIQATADQRARVQDAIRELRAQEDRENMLPGTLSSDIEHIRARTYLPPSVIQSALSRR